MSSPNSRKVNAVRDRASNPRGARRQGYELHGMKWTQTYTNAASSSVLSTKKLKSPSPKRQRKFNTRAVIGRKNIQRATALKSSRRGMIERICARQVGLALPAPPTFVQGAWALKAMPFEAVSPFDSRFPKMTNKKRREQSMGFKTFSPFDDRFPKLFESYSPFDSRFPHGPVPKPFKTFSPFDLEFPMHGDMNFRWNHELKAANKKMISAKSNKGMKTTLPVGSSYTASLGSEARSNLGLPLPRFSPAARTDANPTGLSPRSLLAWMSPNMSGNSQQSPLSSILQRFTGYGSPSVNNNSSINGFSQK